jgi:hypothetical protein
MPAKPGLGIPDRRVRGGDLEATYFIGPETLVIDPVESKKEVED